MSGNPQIIVIDDSDEDCSPQKVTPPPSKQTAPNANKTSNQNTNNNSSSNRNRNNFNNNNNRNNNNRNNNRNKNSSNNNYNDRKRNNSNHNRNKHRNTTPQSSTKHAVGSASWSQRTPVTNPYGSKQPKPVVTNPYTQDKDKKRKFIGGAEMARRKAQTRKKMRGAPITRPTEKVRLDRELNKNINPLERFFGALLRSPASEYLNAAESSQWKELWETICRRVGVQIFNGPMLSIYSDPKTHFERRAALVLEEARNAISTALHLKWKSKRPQNAKSTMYLRAHFIELLPATQHFKITFKTSTKFNFDQMSEIRPGSVFQCIPRDSEARIHNVTLGVVTTGNRDDVEKHGRFQMIACRELPTRSEDVEWAVVPITQLVTDLRCFEALCMPPHQLSFLTPLLGVKKPRHTRFDSNGDEIPEESAIREAEDQFELDQEFDFEADTFGTETTTENAKKPEEVGEVTNRLIKDEPMDYTLHYATEDEMPQDIPQRRIKEEPEDSDALPEQNDHVQHGATDQPVEDHSPKPDEARSTMNEEPVEDHSPKPDETRSTMNEEPVEDHSPKPDETRSTMNEEPIEDHSTKLDETRTIMNEETVEDHSPKPDETRSTMNEESVEDHSPKPDEIRSIVNEESVEDHSPKLDEIRSSRNEEQVEDDVENPSDAKQAVEETSHLEQKSIGKFVKVSNAMFKMPTLNRSQEKAATSFLEASQNSITLVQGPPGTGKTTLLVSIICRYLTEVVKERRSAGKNYKRRRLLVCAPTNKAVTVLASRFLRSMNQDKCPCNIVMVGDGDKLLAERKSKNQSHMDRFEETRTMESTFLFSWIQNLIADYRTILKYFVVGDRRATGLTPSQIYTIGIRLQNQLVRSLEEELPYEAVDILEKIRAGLNRYKNEGPTGMLAAHINALVKILSQIPTDSVWRDVMNSSDLVFCTLAASGGSVFRHMDGVSDLIVDEAAASTEPELYIPFRLNPSRLLAVGDPLQLPATVMSRHAVERGLAKSLHERLMFDCEYEHVMLNVQYRMNPQISVFPSNRFYKGKIGNGKNVVSGEYQRGPCLRDRKPYSFVQVNGLEQQGAGGSHRNAAEVKMVIELVKQLRNIKQRSDPQWYSSDRIRIITFYQAQVSAITSALYKENLAKKIVVATVDSSQGCEADIVIVSFVRSPHNAKKNLNERDAGFLTDDRRMNVALTRARYQLICIGNVDALCRMEGAETIQLLTKNAQERGAVQPQRLMQSGQPNGFFYNN